MDGSSAYLSSPIAANWLNATPRKRVSIHPRGRSLPGFVRRLVAGVHQRAARRLSGYQRCVPVWSGDEGIRFRISGLCVPGGDPDAHREPAGAPNGGGGPAQRAQRSPAANPEDRGRGDRLT